MERLQQRTKSILGFLALVCGLGLLWALASPVPVAPGTTVEPGNLLGVGSAVSSSGIDEPATAVVDAAVAPVSQAVPVTSAGQSSGSAPAAPPNSAGAAATSLPVAPGLLNNPNQLIKNTTQPLLRQNNQQSQRSSKRLRRQPRAARD